MSLLAVLLVLTELATSSAECPVWTTHNDTTGLCQCGSELSGVVKCDPETLRISLRLCYCMTLDQDTNTTVVGFCYLMCGIKNRQHFDDGFFHLQTIDSSQLDRDICEPFNRHGRLCTKCVEGYGFPVYSYSVKCVKCERSHFKFNLIKYLCIAFLPLTAFYFVVVLFKISITSGSQVGFILICQIVGSAIVMRIVCLDSQLDKGHERFAQSTLYFYSLLTIWNLDFFRFVWSPFCLHPETTAVQVLALDYLVAVYPLFLIFLTYLAVSLHDRYPIVVKMWRPAYRVFSCIRKEWNIRGSLVQAFATFLILSYVKILSVSFDLLFLMCIKNVNGEVLNHTYLLSDANLVYFGPEHLPHGILAIAMLVIFNLLPMILLLLYPCGCFQRCLNRCVVRSHLLHTLMDVFQGCYRHQPRDCRYFAGIYLGVRILFLCTFAVTVYRETVGATGYYNISLLIMLLLFMEPYKKSYHNKVEIALFLALILLCFTNDHFHISHFSFNFTLRALSEAILVLVCFLYGIPVVFGKVVPRRILTSLQNLCQRIWNCFCKRNLSRNEPVSDSCLNQLERETSHLLQ